MPDGAQIDAARQIVRDGCDHPLLIPGQRPLHLGGWCSNCDARVRRVLAEDDIVWTED